MAGARASAAERCTSYDTGHGYLRDEWHAVLHHWHKTASTKYIESIQGKGVHKDLGFKFQFSKIFTSGQMLAFTHLLVDVSHYL